MPATSTCSYCGRDTRESWHDVHCERWTDETESWVPSAKAALSILRDMRRDRPAS